MAMSKPSPYTHNIVAYMEREEGQNCVYALGLSEIRSDVQQVYLEAKQLQEDLGIDGMLLPIDHLATRLYSQNREVAIMEWLSWSSYYYWGSYDIKDQNSSTNVTKSTHFSSGARSPAKVFTANNAPYFVNHLEKLPSPTETFVRNYGPRLHHLAIDVRDGETNSKEYIEYVVDAIREQGKRFLPSLIIEYVQRFGAFQRFFTKKNVAHLTHAAGVEEELVEMQAQVLAGSGE